MAAVQSAGRWSRSPHGAWRCRLTCLYVRVGWSRQPPVAYGFYVRVGSLSPAKRLVWRDVRCFEMMAYAVGERESAGSVARTRAVQPSRRRYDIAISPPDECRAVTILSSNRGLELGVPRKQADSVGGATSCCQSTLLCSLSLLAAERSVRPAAGSSRQTRPRAFHHIYIICG